MAIQPPCCPSLRRPMGNRSQSDQVSSKEGDRRATSHLRRDDYAAASNRSLPALPTTAGDERRPGRPHHADTRPLLIGEALLSLPDPPIDDVLASRLPRWHLLQHMRLQFWKRWSAEYLQSLQSRNKWTHQRPQPQIGDLCIVKSELTSPARWPLARVTKLHTGPDGLTRVVTIKLLGLN